VNGPSEAGQHGEAMARMNSVPPGSLTALQAEAKRLGLPPDRIHCLLTIDAFPSDEAPKVRKVADILDSVFTTILTEPLDGFSDPEGKWAGYRYEAIGCLKLEHPLSARVRAATLGAFIFGSFEAEDVELWRQRARAPGTDLYAEVQWRPGYEHPEPFIGGWGARAPKPPEIRLARQALSLIWAVDASRAGIGGPREITPKEARRRLLKLAIQADDDGLEIESYNLSQYTTRGARTIGNWLARAEWGIEDLRIVLQRRRNRQARNSS
jgi:hypothetical protein